MCMLGIFTVVILMLVLLLTCAYSAYHLSGTTTVWMLGSDGSSLHAFPVRIGNDRPRRLLQATEFESFPALKRHLVESDMAIKK
jgi:hypothetical protein